MTSARGVVDRGQPVDIETERFRLRSLKPVDASERWLAWVADPEVVHPTNAPVRHMTRQELASYIAGHDNYRRYLIGVFDKASGVHIGFYFIDVDRNHDTATFNVIIGEKSFWGRGVINEPRGPHRLFLRQARHRQDLRRTAVAQFCDDLQLQGSGVDPRGHAARPFQVGGRRLTARPAPLPPAAPRLARGARQGVRQVSVPWPSQG
jgi:hypothetical protein